jgi:hypothetical protein
MQSVMKPAVAILMAFAFIALAAAPLCAAFLACSMPCCHHTQTAGIKGVATCPLSNSCQTSVSKDDDQLPTTVAKSQRVNPRTIVAAVHSAHIDPTHPEGDAAEVHPAPAASARSLNVLNSVFRI